MLLTPARVLLLTVEKHLRTTDFDTHAND